MKGPSKADWALGELLMDPQRLFVLWAIQVQFCSSAADFGSHYGKRFPIAEAVDGLVRDGFLRRDLDRLILTDTGKQAVSCLRDNTISPFALAPRDRQIPSEVVISVKDATTFVTGLLTKYRVSPNEYLAFEFRPGGIPTEHAGSLIYYVDLARFFNGSTYDELDALCELMARDIHSRDLPFDLVVGLPLVGSHIGLLLARRLRVPYAVLGKERRVSRIKGPIDLLEGYIPKPGETALLFDDAIVSGESIIKATRSLRRAGVIVNHAYAFLDKQHGGTELVARDGVLAFSLLQGEQFAASLRADGILTVDSAQAILREARDAKARRLAQSPAS